MDVQGVGVLEPSVTSSQLSSFKKSSGGWSDPYIRGFLCDCQAGRLSRTLRRGHLSDRVCIDHSHRMLHILSGVLWLLRVP